MAEKRVLIVDDEPLIERAISRTLRHHGVTDIVSVTSSRLGLEAVTDHPEVDWMVITDYDMPEEMTEAVGLIANGGDLCRAIRGLNPNTNLYIVLFTGNTDYIATEQAQHDGFDQIIAKPVDSDVIINQYHEFLRKF